MKQTSFAGRTRYLAAAITAVLLSVSTFAPSHPARAAGDPASALVRVGPRANHHSQVIPDIGPRYERLAALWWQWALSFPAPHVPFFNTGGPVDISAGQFGDIWFLAGANNGLTRPRTGVVPAGVRLFLPMANLINDYPCPPSFGFEPSAGESLEHFLQRTANDFLPSLTDLFAEIDGVPLRNLDSYRATSSMFTFAADPRLAPEFDPCVTGTQQYGVAAGYWLLLAPLPPGTHTLRFGAPSWGQDITYVLEVVRYHR